jgi:phosphoglycolate phosphatase
VEADCRLSLRDGVVAVLFRGSQVLVIQRGADVPFAHHWAPVSGKLEPGESIEAALVRETREETGFVVKPLERLWQSVSQDGAFRLHWWGADIIGGALEPDEREVAAVRWIEAHQHRTLRPIFDSDRHFFNEVLPASMHPVREHRTRAVLFDFDYTLADSSDGAIECANYALRKLGFGEADAVHIRKTIGLSLRETFAQLTSNSHPAAVSDFEAAFVERADQVMAQLTHMYPEVASTAKRLRDRGLTLGIVSTKFRYRIEHILDLHGMASEFSVIVGGEDVERLKPEPDALVLACQRLGVAHSEAVYVGDHFIDAMAAHAAGIPLVAVLTGTCVADDFADRAPSAVIHNLSELEIH